MSNETAVMLVCVARSLTATAAVVGAVFLAYHGKEGWGWLVFVAIVVGAYSVTASSTSD